MSRLSIVAFGVLFSASASFGQSHPASTPTVDYRNIPLSFEPNQGQAVSDFDFVVRTPGVSIGLRHGDALFQLRRSLKQANSPGSQTDRVVTAPKFDTATVSLHLPGASAVSRGIAEDVLPGKSNYLIGKDPSRWRAGIPQYERVRYPAIYPGIDLVYYGTQNGRLEYDFRVAPGADPKTIRLRFTGARDITIDRDGALLLETSAGNLRFDKPTLYQETPKGRATVAGGYRQLDKSNVAFDVGVYDRTQPLVIDPTLIFSTYLGMTNNYTYSTGIALDSGKNAYVFGTTYSLDLPPGGGVQQYNAGSTDWFVVKLNSTGTSVIYTTYLGGAGYDYSGGIAIDSSGNAALAGVTESPDFPMRNASQPSIAGYQDVVAARLNAAGNSLIYSTYLGGAFTEYLGGIAVDKASGAVYVAGSTSSPDFPVINPLQASLAGCTDFFLTKFDPAGVKVYSTYLGGTSCEYTANSYFSATGSPGELAVDSAGNAYFVGQTFSLDFPVTPGVVQSTSTGLPDAIVAKVAPNGSSLVYATYLGGSGYDAGQAISAVTAGVAYVMGVSSSTNFPVSPGAAQPALAGGQDAFLAAIAADGKSLIYSTYFGGRRDDYPAAVTALDSSGTTYLAGSTFSENLLTRSALQPRKPGVPSILYRTSDSGASWNASDNGLSYSFIRSITIDPANPLKIAAASASPLFSSDGGATWVANSGVSLNTLGRANSSVLYGSSFNSIWGSADGGLTWTFLSSLPYQIDTVTSTASDPLLVAAGGPSGIFVSKDGGYTWPTAWTGTALGNVNALAINPANQLDFFAATGMGLYRTVDGGLTWNPVNVNGCTSCWWSDVTFNPVTPSTLYLASGSVFRSTDGGSSWTPLPSSPGVSRLAIAPSNPSIIYGAVYGGGVWRSSDGGFTWAPANVGIEDLNAQTLAVDPLNPAVVYVGQSLSLTPFVAKVGPTGAISYSTYLSGPAGGTASSLASDFAGNTWVTGMANCCNFPTTPGSYRSDLPANSDVYVARIADSTSACSVVANPPSRLFYPYGGYQYVSVLAPSGCAWTASTSDPWLTLTNATTGPGVGTLRITAATNSGPSRSGTVTIGTASVSVTQSAGSCPYNLSPGWVPVPVEGGSYSANLLTNPGCEWDIHNLVPNWVTVTSPLTGSGPAAVTFKVAANPNAAMRLGTVAVGNMGLGIQQNGEATNVIDLVPQTVTAPTTAIVGGSVSVSSSIANIRGQAAGAFRIGFYLSTDQLITTGDRFLGSCNLAGLAAWSTASCSATVTIPADVASGVYYIGAVADDLNAVADVNRTNNSRPPDSGLTNIPGSCYLSESLSYSAGAVRMTFSLGTATPATWKAWLVSSAGIKQLWSQGISAIPTVTQYQRSVAQTPAGTVGVLTALVASPAGLTCSDWKTVNTGGAGPTRAQLEELIRSANLGIPIP